MAEISKFFNSTVTDERWYQAQDFAEYFWMFLTSGLIHVDCEPFINVEVVEDSLQLKVTPGPALIKGHLYRNTKDLHLTVDTPDVLEDRFDRLVLQLDLVPEDGKAGRIKALIKKGVASNDPVIPELTRNERIFELSLGYFRVRKNTASIDRLDYVDERLHEDYCGIVNSLITAPTQAMQQQFDLWFNGIKAGVEGDVNEWVEQQQKEFIEWSDISKGDFDKWFEDIKGSLEGDVATNLTLRIDKAEDNLTTHLVEIASQTEYGHVKVGDGISVSEGVISVAEMTASNVSTQDGNSVQTEIDNLKSSVSNGKALVRGAITDKDSSISVPTNPSFQQLADGIGNIAGMRDISFARKSYRAVYAMDYDNGTYYDMDYRNIYHTTDECDARTGAVIRTITLSNTYYRSRNLSRDKSTIYCVWHSTSTGSSDIFFNDSETGAETRSRLTVADAGWANSSDRGIGGLVAENATRVFIHTKSGSGAFVTVYDKGFNVIGKYSIPTSNGYSVGAMLPQSDGCLLILSNIMIKINNSGSLVSSAQFTPGLLTNIIKE